VEIARLRILPSGTGFVLDAPIRPVDLRDEVSAAEHAHRRRL
jgi:hypothetical protein